MTDQGNMVVLTGADDDGEANPGRPSFQIHDNREEGIFEAILDGETVAGVVYNRSKEHITLLATSVYPAFRGQGVAARLLEGVVELLRQRGESASVTCPYASRFVTTRPDLADVFRSSASGAEA